MGEKIKGVRDFDTHRTNPFVGKAELANSDGTVRMVSSESGSHITRHRDVMSGWDERYTQTLQKYFGLGKSGICVLRYFLQLTDIEDNKVTIDLKECARVAGYQSVQSVFHGLGELLDKQFIARSGRHNLYFLNPIIFTKVNNIELTESFYNSPS